MVPFERFVARADEFYRRTGRPLVTLSYAQSLDGSIASRRGSPLVLSGADSSRLTHQLRASHDGILVGIGTVLSDDPRLNVRFVIGKDPQPVILDSRLRMPLQARLLQRPSAKPWIATLGPIDPQKKLELEAAGARLACLPADNQGRISLPDLLTRLGEYGIYSLMVEGGAAVITSFLGARLVDWVVLTLAPVFIGGMGALEAVKDEVEGSDEAAESNGVSKHRRFPRLRETGYERLGDDLVVWGRPDWGV